MRSTLRRVGSAAAVLALGVACGVAGCETPVSAWPVPPATSSPASQQAATPASASGSGSESGSGVAVQQLVAVARVVDGDTLQLGDGQRVRLLGVDSCESSTPQGPAATAATEQFVAGGAVELGAEAGVDRDRFGRLLRYVGVPGRGDLGEFLVGFPHTGVYQGRNDASPAYRARLEALDDGRACG